MTEDFSGTTQCEGTNRNGEQCEQKLGPGKRYCHWHGGASPDEQANVEERLAKIADKGTKRLLEFIEKEDIDPKYVIKITKDALDRTGIPKSKRQELTGEDGGPIEFDEIAEVMREASNKS